MTAELPPTGDATAVLPVAGTGSRGLVDPNATQVAASPDSASVTTQLAPPGTTPDDGATQLATDPSVGAAEQVDAQPAEPTPPGSRSDTAEATDSDKPARRRSQRWLRRVVLVVVGLIVVVFVAWLLDLARVSGQVVRGTQLGDIPIGGLDRAGLDALADELDAELADRVVELEVGPDTVTSDPVSLGAGVDRDAVTEAALDARRNNNPITGPVTWLSTFLSDEEIDLTYRVDQDATARAVDEVIVAQLASPREPQLVLQQGELTVREGLDGVRVEATEVAERLDETLATPYGDAYAITLTPVATEPEVSTEDVERVAGEATETTAAGAIFRVLDQQSELDPADLREWVRLDTSGAEPTWTIDGEAALEDLKPRFQSLGSEDQQARFNVIDGNPVIVPASETVICCDRASVDEIGAQLLDPADSEIVEEPDAGDDDDAGGESSIPVPIVTLEPEVVGSDEGVAELESLGIEEEVSSFTTMHACCQNRVTNIHRFADLMTGVIIRPGERLSLNDEVGRRTIEKGFVADGAIVNGVLEPQVGGGVSQFATTFFNAAFYAGLDFNEYQSHSLYISRYPRGREATISFPKPDLVVTNNTEYGVLVWPSYTDTSITVTMYSTEHIEVEDLPLERSSRGQCSIFTTPRIRTYPDGTTTEDSVFALYRPGEGLDCNGNSTVPEPSGPAIPPEQPPDTSPPTQAPPTSTPDPGADPTPPPTGQTPAPGT